MCAQHIELCTDGTQKHKKYTFWMKIYLVGLPINTPCMDDGLTDSSATKWGPRSRQHTFGTHCRASDTFGPSSQRNNLHFICKREKEKKKKTCHYNVIFLTFSVFVLSHLSSYSTHFHIMLRGLWILICVSTVVHGTVASLPWSERKLVRTAQSQPKNTKRKARNELEASGRRVSVSTDKCVLAERLRARKKDLILKAQLKCAADDTEKEKNLLEENSSMLLQIYMFEGQRLRPLTPGTPHLLSAVFLSVDLLLKDSKSINEEGGLAPNSSGKTQIICQKIGPWVQLGVPTGQWSQTHIGSGTFLIQQMCSYFQKT